MKLPALLVSSLFIPLIAFATPGGVGSSLQKGLVGHWPLTGESEKVGNEILIDGSFDNWTGLLLNDWNELNDIGLTQVAGVIGNCPQLSNNGGSNQPLLQQNSLTTVIGKTYRITYWVKAGTATTSRIRVYDGTSYIFNEAQEIPTIWTKFTRDFVATTTTSAIYFGFDSTAGDGKTMYYDEVSLKEVKVADTTPYDNHGTIYGATSTTGPHGETDGAMSFDGIDNYAENKEQGYTSSNYFISFWVNPDNISNNQYVFDQQPFDERSILLGYQDNYFNFYDSSYPTGTAFDTQFLATLGTWQHVVMGTDGTKVYAYKNGNKVVEQAGHWNASGTIGFTIGGSYREGQGLLADFAGKLSDIRIYNRALTADEITQLYNEGGKTTVTQNPSLETGLVGHWELDGESEAWTALDGDDWQNSTAYGRIADTNYFSQNGNTIEVINTGSSWPGAGKMYATSEKGKYKIHIKTNLLNGKFQPAFHLYKDGTRVTYTATQVPTTATFTGNHASGFNYGIKSALGIYEATDIIDLTNAPDFDSIHVALLSYDGTASPYFEFQNTDIFVKQLVTADSTPYDNHGKIDGAILATGPNEETNGAMSFDGSNDYINCGTNSILDNEEALSVSAWIKTSYDAPFPGEIGLVKKGTGGTAGWSSPGWSFRLRDDIPAFALRKKDDTGYWDLYSGTPIIDGEWHHIVGTFDTTSIRKYVDGTQTQMTSTGQPYLISNGNCNIGKITNFFNGSMSDIKIYNRVLTPEEITQIYTEKANVVGNKVPSLETGLIGHWPLSGGYTNPTVFADITPYDNHGTFVGTTLTTGINGETGGATSFNGTSDYVDIPLNIYGYNEITYSTWIKIDGSPASSLYSTITGNYGRSGIYIDSNGKARARAWDTTDHYTISTTSVTDNQWHHIAATYDQNNTLTKIYVDGNHENQMSYYPNIINWPSSYIAENPRTTVDILLNGLMADTRLYNRALSADEIKRLYEVR